VDKPDNLDNYRRWLRDERKIDITERTKRHYESVADAIEKGFTASTFWEEFTKNRFLTGVDQEFRQTHNNFVLGDSIPSFTKKSFNSFLEKTFRMNVVQNQRWPNPPRWKDHDPEWITTDNWFDRINDIVRARFVVRYIDGVAFLIQRLETLAARHDLPCETAYIAHDDGYYAGHLYLTFNAEIPRIDWDTQIIQPRVELQITTQLQEVILQLLHRQYAVRRMSERPTGEWKWDYTSIEFQTNYLGHILHYVEGMIVDVRDKTKDSSQ
jgi:ppGpp synthetase/RelA/SpoT-type nucleotidyltranferase